MGILQDQAEEKRDARRVKGKNATPKQGAVYVNWRPMGKDRTGITNLIEDSGRFGDLLDEVASDPHIKFTVKYDTKKSAWVVVGYDGRLHYTKAIYLITHHSSPAKALACWLHAYVNIYRGLPPRPDAIAEEFNW